VPGETLTSLAADGAAVTATGSGGHVLAWTTPDGVERLWVSPTTGAGPGVAIRGGVPVIFPQFSAWGSGPRHGIVRTREWSLAETGPGELTAVWVADDASRRLWPHDAELVLRATAAGQALTMDLTVTNTGAEPFSFTAALHTYLRVSDLESLEIYGLAGCATEDLRHGAGATVLPPGPLRLTGATDLVFTGVTGSVEVRDQVLGVLLMTGSGFSDRVIWNPGRRHGLPDIPAGAEHGFVCVEASVLTPSTVQPQEVWSGRERLEVLVDRS
jgi:glucose-6-phosphate 1-epimerase